MGSLGRCSEAWRMGHLVAHLFVLLFLASPITNSPAKKLRCPAGVTRFSATGSKTTFFECEHEKDFPILRSCPDGQEYHMRKQKCTKVGDVSDVLPLNQKALGRNFVLGGFYDARSNVAFPEMSFWSADVINNASVKTNQLKVDLDVQSLNRKYDRTEYFDIEAALTVDFMAGAVHVAGSAGFLKEDVTSETESNVAMIYHASKYSKTINKNTVKNYIEECKGENQNKYTHVVTSVEYGLDAVFSFKRQTQLHENEMSVTGSLEISINKIPGTTIEGSGSVNMTEWEKELFNKTTLTVYGDFSPEDQLPTTFPDAVLFYKNISKMTGTAEEGYPGAQIINVHLTPYSHMCSGAEVMYNEIADERLAQVVKILDQLEELEVKVNGMMTSDLAVMFNPLRRNLGIYKTELKRHSIRFKSQLQKILPNIRDSQNAEGEEALVNLVGEHEDSQFAFDRSNNFLIDRKRELNAIKFLIETVLDSNVAVADFEKATDVAYIFGMDHLVLLELNILSDTDNTLSFINGNPNSEDDFWYNKPDVNGHVGNLLRSLKAISEVMADQPDYGFMVKLAPFQEEPLVMNALLSGFVASNEFINPPQPPAPTVLDVSPTGFYFKVIKANEFITKLNITTTDVINARSFYSIKDVSDDIEVGGDIEVSIEGLEMAHVYSFHVQYVTAVGTGPKSPGPVKPFSTRPTSPPQDVLAFEVARHYLRVIWQPPALMANKVTASDLSYRVTITGSNGFNRVEVLNSMGLNGLEVKNPDPDTKFTFEVVSLARGLDIVDDPNDALKLNGTELEYFTKDMDVTLESAATTLTVFSLPAPPKMSKALIDEVDKNSATVRWEPNVLASGAELLHYVLEYNTMNSNGSKDIGGTENQLIITQGEEIRLEGLIAGSVYNVRVKVSTTQGESEFSSSLLFMTDFDQDALNGARDDIMAEISLATAEVEDHVTYCAWWRPTGSSIFLEDDSCNGGSMDFDGVFTAIRAGIYQVSASLQMQVEPATETNIWVQHNGQNVPESLIHATNDMSSFGHKIDNTGRTVVLELDEGATVSLFTDNEDTNLGILVPFCVSSVNLV